MTGFNARRTAARFAAAVLCGLAVAASGGCASKKFVREGIAVQDQRLAGLESQVEANQKRIAETGDKVRAVENEALEAQKLGGEARDKAGKAGETADKALNLAKGKLLYQVVLSDVAGNFELNSDSLNDSAKGALDGLAGRLKSENANVFLEIEGHTDSSGSDELNLQLGQRRAESVRRYLNGTHGIPLHKMSVISYGEANPVADNGTREGRAENRRVVIRVLS